MIRYYDADMTIDIDSDTPIAPHTHVSDLKMKYTSEVLTEVWEALQTIQVSIMNTLYYIKTLFI